MALLTGLVLWVTLQAAAVEPPAYPNLGDGDVLLFDSGRKAAGKIEKEDSEKVYIRVGADLKPYGRYKIVAISYANASARSDLAKRWKAVKNTAAAWQELGAWCTTKKLGVEAVACWEHVIALDPANKVAHLALGHAQLDGKWLDRQAVKEKTAEGYVVENGVLKKKEGGGGRTVTKEPKKEDPKDPEQTRRTIADKGRSSSEIAKYENDRKNRAQDAKKFEEKRKLEFKGVPWEKRFKKATNFFNVECNSTSEVTARYARLMDELYAKLVKFFPEERRGRKGKSNVYIYSDAEVFRFQTNMFPGVGGFYRPDTGDLYTYHGTFGITSTTFNVLAHEGTHQLQGKVLAKMDNAPTWLLEGLAVYFGDGARLSEDDKIVMGVIPRDRLLHVQEKIRKKQQTPLMQLVGIEHRQFSGTYYADAWALVHFLVNSGKKGQEMLSAYWNVAHTTKVMPEHFSQLAAKTYGSLDDLEKQYLAHVMQLHPDPAGEIIGKYFFSREFCFELAKAGDDASFYEEEKPGLLVGQTLPGGSAQIEVYFWNNDERAQAKEEYTKERVTAYQKRILPMRYKNVDAERAQIQGMEAFRFTYEDDPSQTISIELTLDGDAIIRELARRIVGKPRKFVDYLIVGYDGTFSIQGSAEVEEFDKYAAEFDKIPQLFAVIPKRRW